ncbi:MAG: hypothetical protein ABEH61_01195 [Haloarculaceae archaeon]
MQRRKLLGSIGGLAVGAVAAGSSVSSVAASGGSSATGSVDSRGGAVAYVRNVEEVHGHLTSSANLLERGRRSDAELHAGHPPDYFAAILPPLRDEDPELATELRGALKTPALEVTSLSAEAYRQHLNDTVRPLLDSAVETVVDSEFRNSTAFSVSVMNALAGRVAGEYSAAVPSAGTVDLVGEYWDARGFLNRIENRHAADGGAIDGAGGETLSSLRSEIEAVAAAGEIRELTSQFRMETTAAAELESATINNREEALAYVRNVEEVKGHLHSSMELAKAGADTASLHAGHPTDYTATILPPLQRVDPELASRVHEHLFAPSERLESDSASEFETFVTDEVYPVLDEAIATAVPDEYTGNTSFDAAVFLALADRLNGEYGKAVPEGEAIELYGEYWDARGFLSRMEVRYEEFESALDSDTRAEVSEELDILRNELETADYAWDVDGSVETLHEFLEDIAAE